MNFKNFKICFTFLIFLSSNILFAQNLIDSLSYYSQKEDFNKAIKITELLKSRSRLDNDTLNYDYAVLVLNSANLYRKTNELLLAEKNYKNSINILEKYKEEDELNLALFINCLGLLYRDQKQFLFAEPLFQKVYDIRGKLLKREDKDYIYSLLNLAYVSKKNKNYDKSENLYTQGIVLQRKVFGNAHFEVANTLNNIAEIYYEKGKYSQAEEHFSQSREIYKRLSVNDLAYVNVSNNLANCLQKLGKYYDAKLILTDVLEKKSKIYEETNQEFILSINNLASVHQNLGEYDKAVKLYLKALAIMDKNTETHGRNYIITINDLAILYQSQGKNRQAESLFLKGVELTKNLLGDKNKEYATSLENFASFYQNVLNLDKAEKFYLQALEIRKSVLGENHPDYEASLHNLSSLYLSIGLNEKAEKYALLSKELFEKVYSKEHPEYASILNNLANTYSINGNFIEAEKLYIEADNIVSKTFNSNHPYHISSLYNLATVNFSQEKFNKAKEYYDKIIALSKDNFDYDSIKMLAMIEDLSNNSKIASLNYNKLFIGFKNKIDESISYLSSDELRLYIKKDFSERFFPLSFLHRYPSHYSTINIGCYENELLVKNLSLRNQQRIKTSIEKSGDASLQEKYQQFIANKRYLIKLEELTVDKRPTSYEQLIKTTETLEKELVRQSTAFADAKKSLAVNWKQIQENLKPNEIAIDLVAYNYYNKKWTDSIVYAAFVVKKGFRAPKYIPLFEQKQLEFLLTKSKNEKDNNRIDKQYSDKAISDLILKPITKELENVNTIYLSPSGLGNQIDFSALPVSETQTLGEKYKVHILGSTAEIVNYKVANLEKKTNLELLLYGNIDYNKSEVTNKLVSDTLATNNVEFTTLTTRSSTVKEYGYLVGSKVEVTKINALALKNNYLSTIVDDKKATEESIKLLDGRTIPFILHLATHGFFFPDPKQEIPKRDLLPDSKAKIHITSDDPMIRSGLLFAGANKYWGKPTENITTDDGIMTASEISNLDLSTCQLVVLSACETGLGDINGSEGVFGLQRAFKMAGVKNIIMSLWKVPDAQTAELFDVFYSECFAGKTIHEAFQTAQAKMKLKYSSYYWAGFVLLE